MTTRTNRRRRISETDQLIGRTLRAVREQRSASSKELAEALRITPSELDDREQGQTACSAGEIWKAAAALKTPVQILFQGVHADNLDIEPILHNLAAEEQLLALYHGCKPEHRAEFMDILIHETAGLRDDLP